MNQKKSSVCEFGKINIANKVVNILNNVKIK